MSTRRPQKASTAAVCFGITSALLFAFTNVALRFAAHAGAFDVALIRGAVFSLALAPIALAQPAPRLLASRRRTALNLGLFTATTILTTVTWFLGLAELPLATATSLFSLKALFAVLGAAFLLSEPLTPRRLGAVCIGFIGGAILLNPGEPDLPGAALVLCAAASSALSGIFYAQLVREQPPGRVLLVSSVLQLLVLAPIALVHTATLPPFTLLMGSTNAILSIGVMYTLAWAYRGADVGVVASLEYLRLPFAAGLAFVFFSERPTASFFVGSAVVILGAALANMRPRAESAREHGPLFRLILRRMR